MLGAALLLAALWLRWWLQPERQIPRAQARLLSSMGRRDFGAMTALLAVDYRDRWRQDRAAVIERSREVFSQFVMLSFERESRGFRLEGDRGLLTERIRVKGIGGPLAMLARDTVNVLHEPFVTEWHRRSWKPWDWELKSVAHPELELP